MKLNCKAYDILKIISTVIIPAVVVFLNTVLSALSVEAETISVVTTIIGAVGILIGSMIGVSSKNYWKEESNGKAEDMG